MQVKDTTAGIVPLAKAPWMLDTEEKEEDIHVVQVCIFVIFVLVFAETDFTDFTWEVDETISFTTLNRS